MRIVDLIRRNHALEHATIAVLAGKGVRGLIAGYSTAGGFWLLAPTSASQVEEAAEQALRRLSSGESGLAISPHCGTNLAVAGILGGAAMRLVRARRGRRKPGLAVSAAVVLGALMVSRPLGEAIQRRFTTLAEVGSLALSGVKTVQVGRYRVHRVSTRQT